MKRKTTKLISNICMVYVFYFCLFTVLIPSVGAEGANQGYEISITQSFSDKTEQPLEDYQANIYQIQDSNNKYLQAEYDQTAKYYRYVGSTEIEEDGTRFRVGCNSDNPSSLLIIGLPEDSYWVSQLEVTDSYMPLFERVSISIGKSTATLNGDYIEDYDGTQAKITVVSCHPFQLPKICCTNNSSSGFIIVVILVLIATVTITYRAILTKRKREQKDETQAEWRLQK